MTKCRHGAATMSGEYCHGCLADASLMNAALLRLTRYFVSGNSVPVERATIPAKNFWEIVGPALIRKTDG